MRLTYSFTYKGEHLQRLFNLCNVSRCLYNQTLYTFRQSLIKNGEKWLFYNDLKKIMRATPNLEGEINFKLLKAQCSQQCLRGLDANIRSFCKTIKYWKNHKEKYNARPKLPNYMRSQYREVVFPNQSSKLEGGFLWRYKDLQIPIPQWDKFQGKLAYFQQARIIPRKNNTIEVQIIYEQALPKKIGGNKVASIDIGINNLVAMVLSNGLTIIINGKGLKAINQWANKQLAKAKSDLMKVNGETKSKRINAILSKRGRRIKDILHKASRTIVNILIENGVSTLVVGYNKEWKQNVNLGKVTNPAFVQIPFNQFIKMLEYKCALAGIELKKTEEGYTSKCDALALEKIGKHETYLGERKKRGLFQSSTGKLINADVNGALNIMRKVVGDSPIKGIIDSAWLFRPTKCSIEKCCGLRIESNTLYTF